MPDRDDDAHHAHDEPAAWNELLAGVARNGLVAGIRDHRPSVAVLACSDARVPPSVIFDQPAGQLFVVRIAGNTASPAALASLDYAVDQLGVTLVVVLGHTECGAVAAAAAGTCGGHLTPVVTPICELAAGRPDLTPAQLVSLNVAAAVQALRHHHGPTGRAARRGDVSLRGAVFDLTTGRLREVDHAEAIAAARP